MRCQTPIHLGVFLLFVAVVGGTSIRHVRRMSLPPNVRGTLRHWKIGVYCIAMEIDLTEFGKHALTIGSGATCDVMVLDADLEPQQARLFAEKSTNATDIYLVPMGEVRKGYSSQRVRFILRHGDTFRMGNPPSRTRLIPDRSLVRCDVWRGPIGRRSSGAFVTA